MGWRNESLFVVSGSHDQDGCHAHIWLKNLLLQIQRANDLVAWYVALGPWAHHSLFNLVSYESTFIWGKLLESHLMEENTANDQSDKRFMFI